MKLNLWQAHGVQLRERVCEMSVVNRSDLGVRRHRFIALLRRIQSSELRRRLTGYWSTVDRRNLAHFDRSLTNHSVATGTNSGRH